MRTLHTGLRVADLERSLAFYTCLGYEVLGHVPETELGSLTMLKLPSDEFVALELVHDPGRSHQDPGGFSHLVVQVDALHAMVSHLKAQGRQADAPASPECSNDFWTCWVTDPDGHRLEVVQWPSGHPDGMTHPDLVAPDAREGGAVASHRTAKDVVEEMLRRQRAGDDTVFDDLVAADMVNHAAGSQGREGLKQILRTIEADLGPTALEQHHLIGEDDLVAQHLTLHGTHRSSTMPLLAGVPVTEGRVAWTFIHIWRVANGMLVEHWPVATTWPYSNSCEADRARRAADGRRGDAARGAGARGRAARPLTRASRGSPRANCDLPGRVGGVREPSPTGTLRATRPVRARGARQLYGEIPQPVDRRGCPRIDDLQLRPRSTRKAALVDHLSQQCGVPAIASGAAVVAALRACGVERVQLVHPPWFDVEFDALGATYFRDNGFDAWVSKATRLPDDPARMTPEHVVEWVVSHLADRAEAVFLAGNGFRTAGAIEELERRTGRIVLGANQALLWGTLTATRTPWLFSGHGGLLRRLRRRGWTVDDIPTARRQPTSTSWSEGLGWSPAGRDCRPPAPARAARRPPDSSGRGRRRPQSGRRWFAAGRGIPGSCQASPSSSRQCARHGALQAWSINRSSREMRYWLDQPGQAVRERSEADLELVPGT